MQGKVYHFFIMSCLLLIYRPLCVKVGMSNVKVGMGSVQLAALIEGFSSFPSVNNGSQAARPSLPREERRGGGYIFNSDLLWAIPW